MRAKLPLLSSILVLLALSGTVSSEGVSTAKRPDPTIDPLMVAAGFLDSHPDLLHRSRGLAAYGEKDHVKGFREFKRAAYYGDKPSQAIVGEMLWIGLGTAKDRGLAYIWMDLAAERGYASFAEKRAHYWAQLDTHERARAVREGPAIHADYADSVAEPRLALVLRRERKNMTGSRLGSTSSPVQITVPGVGSIDATQYYNPKYWDPRLYREWQDSIWTNLRIGRVSVGDVQQVQSGSAEPARTTEVPGPGQGQDPPPPSSPASDLPG